VLLAICTAAPQYTTVFTLPDPPVEGAELHTRVEEVLLLWDLWKIPTNFTITELPD
jgi:hypothetical protein